MALLIVLSVLLLLGLLPAFGVGADTRDREFTVGTLLGGRRNGPG